MRKLFRIALCVAGVHGVVIASPVVARAQDESLPPLPVPAGEAPATVPPGEPPAVTHGTPAAPTTPVVVLTGRADPGPASVATAEPPTRWYGYQTLAVDLLSGLVVAAGFAAQSGDAAYAGGIMYLAGGPIVQAVHHRGYVPWLDFGIRLTAPFIGTFLGVLVTGLAGGAPGCNDSGDFVGLCSAVWGAAVGFGIGAGVAVALDAAVFSHEKVPEPASASRTSPGPFDLSFAPMVTMNRDDRRNLSPIVGIGGTF
jgi:hypothetical protein